MLRFFRLIRRKLIEEQKTRQYMYYAIGEIFLVVIGILIALQINNWNEDRKDQILERNYIELLIRDLQVDSTKLVELVHTSDTTVYSKNKILAYQTGEIEKTDSLSFFFLRAVFTAIEQFVPNKGAIEEIQNAGGLSLIKDEDLRSQILEMYNDYDRFNKNVAQYHLDNILRIRELVYEKANGSLFINFQEYNEETMERLARDSDIRNRLINNWAVTYNRSLKRVSEVNAETLQKCELYLKTLNKSGD